VRRLRVPSILSLVLISLVLAMLVVTVLVWIADDDTPDVREVLEGEGAAPGDLETGNLQPADLDAGDPAPAATLDWLDGGESSLLSEELSKPTVLNFWSSTCAPCLSEMPALEAVHTSTETVEFIGVDVTDTEEAGAAMLERTGVTYRNARDPKGELLAAFGGTALPFTVLLDDDGTVLAEHSGALTEAEMRGLLQEHGLSR
jgi:thiol-disulfide isomerase/thioredoxin